MPIMLAYCCGMRLGECLALTWDNVDFENHIIKIEFSQYDKKSAPKKDTPKSLTSIRSVTFGKKINGCIKAERIATKKR